MQNKNDHHTSALSNEVIHSIIRVNHAGEYGAVQIYKGQLSVLRNSENAETIQHMLEQEKEHLRRFDELMIKRHVRPTILSPIWHMAGYAMGAASAFIGEKAAMACTVAVEEVIDEHYAEQEKTLGHDEKGLKDLISKCREEENEHKEIGYAHGAIEAPGYTLLTGAVKTAFRLAIWLSKRI